MHSEFICIYILAESAICNLYMFKEPKIDYKERFRQAGNWFLGSLKVYTFGLYHIHPILVVIFTYSSMEIFQIDGKDAKK